MATSRRRRLDRPSNYADNPLIAPIVEIERRVGSPGASSQRFFPGLRLFVGGDVVPCGPHWGHAGNTIDHIPPVGLAKETQKDTLFQLRFRKETQDLPVNYSKRESNPRGWTHP